MLLRNTLILEQNDKKEGHHSGNQTLFKNSNLRAVGPNKNHDDQVLKNVENSVSVNRKVDGKMQRKGKVHNKLDRVNVKRHSWDAFGRFWVGNFGDLGQFEDRWTGNNYIPDQFSKGERNAACVPKEIKFGEKSVETVFAKHEIFSQNSFGFAVVSLRYNRSLW